MNTTAPFYDYEEIMKLLNRRDAEFEKLENRKNILHGKQLMALKRHYESIERFESAENINNTMKTLMLDKAKIRSNLDQEHKALTKELENLQQLYDEVKIKRETKSETFFENAEKLCQEFQKMPSDFGNNNTYQMIKDCTKAINFYKQETAIANEEMQKLKDLMRNCDSLQGDLSGLVVTKMIQKESLQKYGDPMELQLRLSELTRNNEALMNEIQDIKVKYGI
ncbi:hypothetical protein ILUMI_01861 [Ignelater luminosus]|uniref:Uncharacterized protein n=1 Tax=Ignelater luminosus TaxID=2038154 RepID=A0A8K0DJC4_IGNLU|nr:hypothetical protein ILUMI_01861 [Ignelater luminosus]